MRRIAVYTRSVEDEYMPHLKDVVAILTEYGVQLLIHESNLKRFEPLIHNVLDYRVYKDHQDLPGNADFLVSIGGDGTLLDASLLVKDSGIPIVGINTGRLGFLARIGLGALYKDLEGLLNGRYEIEERTMLCVKAPANLFGAHNFALNELTLHKKDTTSMVKIHTYVNNEFLNTYWADGLIVCTPTGSTAYSLSCGGPIVYPGSDNFVITPVAPHNLNVRPIVLPDSSVIKLKIEGRSEQFLASLDSRFVDIDAETEVSVQKNSFPLRLLRLPDNSFLETIRNKMNWGLDMRN